jgi:hypothetical protein
MNTLLIFLNSMSGLIKRFHTFLKKYEHFTMPIILVGGFIIDNLTLTQIDRLFENVVLFVYVTISAIMLFLLYGPHQTKPKSKLFSNILNFAPFILQYCIGGLFSGLFIFYFRSGTLITSLPFLIVLFALMAGNEYFYRKFPKASFQLVVFFIALLAYTNLIVPIITKKMGTWPFIGATALATLLMYIFVAILDRPNGLLHGKHRRQLHRRLLATLCIFVTLYFTNVIPPLPLSMKTGAIGYQVIKNTTGTYDILVEDAPWYLPFSEYSSSVRGNGSLYAFSAIYAPTDINLEIFHQWSRYDETNGWVKQARVPINIVGGRGDGYRGFSFKQNLSPGDWRVDVITEQGQIIGRMNFDVSRGARQKPTTITH